MYLILEWWYNIHMENNTMTLLFSSVDGSRSFEVSSHREASMLYRKFIEDGCLGSSEVGSGKLISDGKVIATVCYNGKVIIEA